MARIQQSIEIRVPVHVAYNQLVQFEDYPQFMEEVRAVEQVDEGHLHWTTIMSNRPVEWDAQIVEQQADRCIAWHNVSGPTNSGRVDVEPLGDDASRVTLTLDAEPQQVPGSPSGDSAQEMEQRLRMDLARMKDFIEQRGSRQQAGGMAGMQQGADASPGAMQSRAQTGEDNATYAAGSEGMSGDEDFTSPVVSSGQTTQQGNTTRAAGRHEDSADMPGQPQTLETTQSDYSLSQADPDNDDGRYSIAEEVNFDEQSNAMRHVGQMPQDTSIGEAAGASDAVGKAMSQGDRGTNTDIEQEKLKQALKDKLPPPQ
ncbi:SRPBCC family protein [Oxalobacteraceae bacterium OM1]|nr:SRPBCC family protein [Oxalobacteraceae bacterium OM1]